MHNDLTRISPMSAAEGAVAVGDLGASRAEACSGVRGTDKYSYSEERA
jgi:hypothetical protein